MEGLVEILADTTDPVVYSILLFLFTAIATLALPLPVEMALFFNLDQNVYSKAAMVGGGKAAAAVIALRIGNSINKVMSSRLMRTSLAKMFVQFCNWLVVKFHYAGLYFILSIPLMVDTVPVYLFGIFNEEGVIRPLPFAYVNFLAGVNRVLIIMVIFELYGVKIVT